MGAAQFFESGFKRRKARTCAALRIVGVEKRAEDGRAEECVQRAQWYVHAPTGITGS